MKKIMFVLVAFLLSLTAIAQPERPDMEPKGKPGAAPQSKPGKFSPEKFQAEMEQFIVKEACLTPAESSKFFPLYNEMRRKMRVVFDKQRRIERSNPTTDAACRKAIKESDDLDIELKEIQRTYHNKFMSALSPSKVFKILKAEDRFHHRMLKHDGDNRRDKQPNKKDKKPNKK